MDKSELFLFIYLNITSIGTTNTLLISGQKVVVDTELAVKR